MDRHTQLHVSIGDEPCTPMRGKAQTSVPPRDHLTAISWRNGHGELTVQGLGGTTFFYLSAKASTTAQGSMAVQASDRQLIFILNGKRDSQATFAPGQIPLDIPPFAFFAAILPPGTGELRFGTGASGFQCFGFRQHALHLLAEEFTLIADLSSRASGEPDGETLYLPLRFLPPMIHKYLDKLHKTDKRAFALNVHCKEMLYQIVKLYHTNLMAVSPKPSSTQDADLLQKAIDLIRLHVAEPSFTVDSLAQQVGLSRRNLYRLFENQGQPTPQRLLLSSRLDKARELLRTTDHSVNEITAMVGFNYLPNFSKLYKQTFGIPPKNER